MNLKTIFLFAIEVVGIVAVTPTVHGADDSRPNIVVILTDDAGYSDFSCYGNKDYQTPNVDRIAANGVRFTNGYVSESVCSPSRAGLLTGRYQHRFGYEFNLPTPAKPAPGDDAEFMGLPVSETLLSTALKEMGYTTDREVGRILDFMEKENLSKNTLLFFINDNGGPLNMGAHNGNLRGQKGTCMEGGIRVPFIVQWPEQIPAGVTYGQPVISLDIFATAMAAAGGKHHDNLDGVNLLPFLNGTTAGTPHERLYWRRSFYSAVREGDWKLVHLKDRLPMLFNLRSDPSERTNLASQQVDRAQ